MMDQNVQSGTSDAAVMQVKIETVDENATAFVLGSQESSAPCEDSAAAYTGAAATLDQADTQQAATTSAILLYPVSTERFLPASGDEKRYSKLGQASEKTFAPSSDFCSQAVLYLIEAVGRRWGLYETRERSQLFQSVQEEMAAKGHVLPVEKIRRKWNNLIVTYKRVKDRSRETGHAKTSWEFFDLMDATLCDTVGAQVMKSNKSKTSNAISSATVPLMKIAAKQLSESAPIIHPYGDFTTPAVIKSMTHVDTGAHINSEISSTASATTVPVTSVALETTAPEIKPLILLNGDIITTSIQPASLSPCPSLVSSPYPTETLPPTPSPSFESTSNVRPRVKIRSGARLKAPLIRPGTAGRRGRQDGQAPQPSQLNNHNIHALSSLPPTFSSHSPFPTYDISDGQTRMDAEELGSNTSLLEEVLRRQEEQAYLEQVAGRRADARERRRERREVRMAESLGRIATALELLSSKQDTVIALLQRLAERK